MTGRPYVVGGRTYVPVSGKGYEREGWASWYGTAFHGRLTANGEIFDRGSIAAAHPTLPLPSYVRVTNLVNKRSMIVRVNDRGPYEQDRLIDVSERVAETLEFRRKGTTRVRVEYVGKASTRGSDDEKLLASLRTDGVPAPFGGTRGRVMMADLGNEPPARAPARAFKPDPAPVTAERGEMTAEAAEEDETRPVRAVAPRPVQVASSEAPLAGVETETGDPPPPPPRRPVEVAAKPVPSPVFQPTMVAAAPRPVVALDLVPPQRPALAGIY